MSGPRRKADSRPAPLSIRFTDAEKHLLRRLAGDVPLGAYIRNAALKGDGTPRRARRSAIVDHEALGRALGLLGQSRMASNLNQLAKAANMGSLPVTQETEADLRQACVDIAAMRRALMLALGKEAPEAAENPSAVFARASRAAGERESRR